MSYILLIFALLMSFPAWAAVSDGVSGQDLKTQKEVHVEWKEALKGTVVVFLSSKCPCSNSHVEILKNLAAQYKDFHFLGVHSNEDESVAAAAEYFKKADLPFPVIQDNQAQIADELKAYKTPHVFVFSPEGKVLYRGGVTNSSIGPAADKMYLQNALEDISQNKPVRTPETRTLGCVISREGSRGWE